MTAPREPADPPLTDAERAELGRIIGPSRFRLIDSAIVPENVARAKEWCERHGAYIEFANGQYTCYRGADVLARAGHLGVLLARLERLEEGGAL